MASVTMQKIQTWESKLSNGFKFDVQNYLVWSDKQAVKSIPLEDGRILTATLGYERVKAENGFSYTGKVQPYLHLQVWKKGSTEGIMIGTGMGKWINIGAEQDKKKWNELCKLSTVLDEAKIMELYQQYAAEIAVSCHLF